MRPARYLRRLAALLFPAAALVVLLPALPASATATGTICTTFGAHLCIGVGNISLGEQVISVNGPGRTLFWGGGGYGTISTLAFKADTGLCLAQTPNSGNVMVESCNAYGTNWEKVQGTNTTMWYNTRTGRYLSSQDCVGCIVAVLPHPFSPWEQQFNGPA